MHHLLQSSAETFCHSCVLVGKVDTGCAVFLLQHLCEDRGPEHGAVTVLTEISDLRGCKQHEHLHVPAVLPHKKKKEPLYLDVLDLGKHFTLVCFLSVGPVQFDKFQRSRYYSVLLSILLHLALA